MHSKYRLMLILALLASFPACAKFKEGDCIQNTKDGYVFRITKVGVNQYTVQGWVEGNKWGVEVTDSFDTSRYVKIPCPFSTQILQREK